MSVRLNGGLSPPPPLTSRRPPRVRHRWTGRRKMPREAAEWFRVSWLNHSPTTSWLNARARLVRASHAPAGGTRSTGRTHVRVFGCGARRKHVRIRRAAIGRVRPSTLQPPSPPVLSPERGAYAMCRANRPSDTMTVPEGGRVQIPPSSRNAFTHIFTFTQGTYVLLYRPSSKL